MFNFNFISNLKFLFRAFINHFSFYYNKIVLFISTLIFNRFKVDIVYLGSHLLNRNPYIFTLAVIPYHFNEFLPYLQIIGILAAGSLAGYLILFTPHPILGFIGGVVGGITGILIWHLHNEDIIDIAVPLFEIEPDRGIVGIRPNFPNILGIIEGIGRSLIFTSSSIISDLAILLRIRTGDYTTIPLTIETFSWMMEHFQPFMETLTSPSVVTTITTVPVQVPGAISILFFGEAIRDLAVNHVISYGDNYHRIFFDFIDINHALNIIYRDPETQRWFINAEALQHFRDLLGPCRDIRDIGFHPVPRAFIHQEEIETQREVWQTIAERLYQASIYTPIVIRAVVIFIALTSYGYGILQRI